MNSNQLPLQDLFTQIREYGFNVGVGEYLVLLRALRAGFGLSGRKELRQLCTVLWVKSDEEALIFNRLFDQLLEKAAEQVDQREVETGSAYLADDIAFTEEEEIDEPQTKPQGKKTNEPLKNKRTVTPKNYDLKSDENLEDSKQSPPIGLQYPRDNSSQDISLEIDEPVQIARAARSSERSFLELSRPKYNLLTDYFPVTRRQMKQSWRHLRIPVREGPPVELDIAATIKRISREGVFIEPILMPRRTNRAEVILLVDRDGSMVPFHGLSNMFVDTLQRGGRLQYVHVYYFHDHPSEFIYHDPARLNASKLDEVFSRMGANTVLLVLSDAGAARGYFDEVRVKKTKNFVNNLKQNVRRYAWINPLPNDRWPDTTAGEIARFIPMFDLSRQGLEGTISALRGRYVYWEKPYPWMK